MHRNTLVIVHGESERILVNAIKSKLRIPVDPYPIDRGSGSFHHRSPKKMYLSHDRMPGVSLSMGV